MLLCLYNNEHAPEGLLMNAEPKDNGGDGGVEKEPEADETNGGAAAEQKAEESDGKDDQEEPEPSQDDDAPPENESMEADDGSIFAAMQVWHCQNCIQLNQIEDDICCECGTPKDSFGLKPCPPSSAAPQVGGHVNFDFFRDRAQIGTVAGDGHRLR